ncbi:hypothetical protein ES703_04101 [subsurface metagenome]
MIGAVVLRNDSNKIIAISVELMDLKDVARYLQLNYETVRRWAKDGKFPALKLGGVWRVRMCDLEEWIDKQVGGASIE